MSHKWEKVEFDDLVKGDVFRVNHGEGIYTMESRDLTDNLVKAYLINDPESYRGAIFFIGSEIDVFFKKIEIPEETDRLQTAISVLVDKLHTETENHKQTRARLIELQEKWEEKRLVDMGEDSCQEEVWEDVSICGVKPGDRLKITVDDNRPYERTVEKMEDDSVRYNGGGYDFISDICDKENNIQIKRLKKQTCCGTCHGAYDGKAE
jgi:hypothetical protein